MGERITNINSAIARRDSNGHTGAPLPPRGVGGGDIDNGCEEVQNQTDGYLGAPLLTAKAFCEATRNVRRRFLEWLDGLRVDGRSELCQD